jgi:UDP-2-acetamido-2,6-beta-L-arabino-hexul-4-ose reductase
MNVAITGESGFLGQHLSEYYESLGKVVSLGRNYVSNLNKVAGCDVLIHAAGMNRGDPNVVHDTNVKLAEETVSELRRLGIRVNVKHISSIQENNSTPYGISKLKSKKIFEEYCRESETSFESFPLPNLFGTKGKPNYNSVVNTFAYNVVHGIECKYNSNRIGLCWVKDAIQVIDGKTQSYKIHETSVDQIYFTLIEIRDNHRQDSELGKRLEEIYNYYNSLK